MLHIKMAIAHAVTYKQIFCPQPPSPDSGDQKVKFNFAEHGHVAYQIKENRECSHIVANIIRAAPLPPTDPGGQKVKIQLFQKMVMDRQNGMANAATW